MFILYSLSSSFLVSIDNKENKKMTYKVALYAFYNLIIQKIDVTNNWRKF